MRIFSEMSASGTLLPRAIAAACPQLAKADFARLAWTVLGDYGCGRVRRVSLLYRRGGHLPRKVISLLTRGAAGGLVTHPGRVRAKGSL
jgi:hypothetical protein